MIFQGSCRLLGDGYDRAGSHLLWSTVSLLYLVSDKTHQAARLKKNKLQSSIIESWCMVPPSPGSRPVALFLSSTSTMGGGGEKEQGIGRKAWLALGL